MALETAVAKYEIIERVIAISDDFPAPGAYEESVVSSRKHGPYDSENSAKQSLEPIRLELQRQGYRPTNQMSHEHGPVELVKVGSPPLYVNFSIQKKWVPQE